ncbi:alpha/beta fold hydrolase [Streptomyces sp. NPDC102365]|uniref:alpha/beta fold hydrolase n=1 Tax=Streptomyces sp. NPDC102365 TaxID=3366162 RepID=UPI0038052F4D
MHDTPQVPYTPRVPSLRPHPVDSARREPAAPSALAPASFAQQRLWFLAQLPGGNEAYNEPVTFTLRGPLDTAVLRRALDALVVRQQALRTRLAAVDGEVYQHIDPPETGFALTADDLSGLPDSAARLDELRLREATTPFDLARGPLCRGRLLTLGEDHHVLLLTVHHTIFDGRSMTVMMSELGVLYLLDPDFGIRDSFFDIGGTSLSAIKMAHGIREALGTTIPVRDLMVHPTIEGLAVLVRRGRSGTPPSNLIAFREGGAGGNVVCVHPAGGTAFCYLPLAGKLPAEVGLYGIQSPGVNPGEAFLPDVEAMAEACLRLIEPFADGPVVLTGLSYGGLVAHEMGRRLAAAGRADIGVVLLDTRTTEDPETRATVTAPVDLAEFRDKLVKFNGMYPGIDDEQIDQYFRLYNHNRRTARDHLPASSAARLVLVEAVERTTTDPASLPEVRDFWRRRAENGFRVEPLDCDHWEVLESRTSPRVAAVLGAELATLATLSVAAPAVTEEA